jgi:spermidine/putrescine-binding protein
MKMLLTLFLSIFLLAACSKEEAAPAQASDYFVGTWKLRTHSSPGVGTKVTLEKTGKATFHVLHVEDTAQGYTGTWRYDKETKVLTFDVPAESYRVVEQQERQFTAVTLQTNAGLIFSND